MTLLPLGLLKPTPATSLSDNMIPGFFVSLRAAFENGDHGTAREMQTRANRAIAIVLKAAKAGGKLSALASIKAFMRDCQGLPAGTLSWTA